MSIDELFRRYVAHCQAAYRKPTTNKPTSTAKNAASALKSIATIWLPAGGAKMRVGRQDAERMSPTMLRAIQRHLAASGYARSTVNMKIKLVQRVYQWAAMEQLAPEDLPHRLSIVKPLRRGQSDARETDRVKPVAWEHVAATLAHAPLKIATMIEVHWHTGMRPGELVQMCWSDIGMHCDPWVFRPREHKLQHHDIERVIALGPTCQSLLRQWRPHHKGDELWPMHVTTYSWNVREINRRNGLRHWFPNQIRHSCATRLRQECGIEAARAVLGHQSISTTEIYAEANTSAAMDAMREFG